MTVESPLNQRRRRALNISRAFKELFLFGEQRRRWAWRTILLADDQTRLRRASEIALADLARFCFAMETTFDPNPTIAGRRDGRRDVWLRVAKYLNLDEAIVQKLMEIDDGNE